MLAWYEDGRNERRQLGGRHSPESWKDLWEEVFSLNREEGSEAARVRVEARLDTESEGEGLLVWSVVVV